MPTRSDNFNDLITAEFRRIAAPYFDGVFDDLARKMAQSSSCPKEILDPSSDGPKCGICRRLIRRGQARGDCGRKDCP